MGGRSRSGSPLTKGSWPGGSRGYRRLMLAAGQKRGDDIKIGLGEQALGVRSGGLRRHERLRSRGLGRFHRRRTSHLRGFDEESEMAIAREGAQMLQTDSCKGGNLFLCEVLLARSYGNHFFFSPYFDARAKHGAVQVTLRTHESGGAQSCISHKGGSPIRRFSTTRGIATGFDSHGARCSFAKPDRLQRY